MALAPPPTPKLCCGLVVTTFSIVVQEHKPVVVLCVALLALLPAHAWL